jgi:hypothetical protein
MSNQVNIYRHEGKWCYALFVDAEFDSADTIGCEDDATEQEVRAYLTDYFVFGSQLTITALAEGE